MILRSTQIPPKAGQRPLASIRKHAPVVGDVAGANSCGATRSAWQDISARSRDISAFARRGGKMIVPHGVSDPVFSISDMIC